MGSVRIVILVVAAAAAIGLALVVRQMAAHRPASVVARVEAPPMIQVLVARRDLPIGAHIAPADLVWRSFPATAINHAWITTGPAPGVGLHIGPPAAHADDSAAGTMQQVVGAFVHEPIFEGEPILERQIVRGGSGGYMSLALQPGMRAVAVPVTAETGAGGFILPGDHVDVLLTRKPSALGAGPAGEQAASAETILSDVRVLGVDQQSQSKPGAAAMLAASVTLEVPAAEVEGLLAAKARGDLSLDLRSYADAAGSDGGQGAPASGSVRFVRAGQVSEVSAP